VGSGKWEVGGGKWEVRSGKSEVGSGKWEVGVCSPGFEDWGAKSQNGKFKMQIAKYKVQNISHIRW